MAPGKNFLLITGILYSVFSGFMLLILTLLTSLVLGMGITTEEIVEIAIADLGTAYLSEINFVISILMILLIGLFIFYFFTFLLGLLGIIFRKSTKMALLLLILGWFMLILDIIAVIINALAFGLFGLASGVLLVVPILYVVGAAKNRKAGKTAKAS